MSTCDECKHWFHDSHRHKEPYGGCKKWLFGYGVEVESIPENGILVEYDEEWGAIMGPKFGCVLFERE